MFCALDRIRTYDLLRRRQTLYPLSYEGGMPVRPAPKWDSLSLSGKDPLTKTPDRSTCGARRNVTETAAAVRAVMLDE